MPGVPFFSLPQPDILSDAAVLMIVQELRLLSRYISNVIGLIPVFHSFRRHQHEIFLACFLAQVGINLDIFDG